MSSWQPLSVRRRLREPDGPYDGVPGHLEHALIEWLRNLFWDPDEEIDRAVLGGVVAYTHLETPRGLPPSLLLQHVLDSCREDEDVCLDIVDAALHVTHDTHATATLGHLLRAAGSEWKVNSDRRGLEQRVDESANESFQLATAPADEASGQLREAWSAVYGRQPNPSDAWDHAIKAVEAVLVPIVTPNDARPTLGRVLGQLASSRVTLDLDTSHRSLDSVETLEAILRLLWPNPDRHSGGAGRMPSQHEAEAVVHLAVTIVQWTRSGVIAGP